MLLVMVTFAQVKPRPRKPLPIKKEKADTTKVASEKNTAPVILTNPNLPKIDPKLLQKNQPEIGNKNIQNIENQKEVNKAAEEIRNRPKVVILEANPFIQGTAFTPKNYKLKVTLTDVQSIKTSHKRPLADIYNIKQKISYVVGGKSMIPVDGNLGRFKFTPENELTGPGRNPGQPTSNYYLLKTTSFSNYIRVSTFDRLSKNINASFIYSISESELTNPDARMIIHTALAEENYSTLQYDFEKNDTEVSIREVLAVLTGKRKLSATKPYFDQDIAKGIYFDDFGGFKMYLTKVNDPDKIILEGPIRRRTNSGKEKAAVWMRFELVE